MARKPAETGSLIINGKHAFDRQVASPAGALRQAMPSLNRTGRERMIRAAKQDTVKVHYIGRLSDGTIFDQSPEDRPLLFIIGGREVIAGFEEAVEGMYQGESKTVTIPCEKAYGPSKPELVEEVDRGIIGKTVALKVGRQLEVTNQDGSKFRVMVRAVSENRVTLDGNHPLAGQDLVFDIRLLEVRKHHPVR
jgi:peptidylprolyl isomerase